MINLLKVYKSRLNNCVNLKINQLFLEVNLVDYNKESKVKNKESE